jgi:hypothetical protein
MNVSFANGAMNGFSSSINGSQVSGGVPPINGLPFMYGSPSHATTSSDPFRPATHVSPKDSSIGTPTQAPGHSSNQAGSTDVHEVKQSKSVAGTPENSAYERWRSTVLQVSTQQGQVSNAGAPSYRSAAPNVAEDMPLIDLSSHPKPSPPTMGVFSNMSNNVSVDNSTLSNIAPNNSSRRTDTNMNMNNGSQRTDTNMILPKTKEAVTPRHDDAYDKWRSTVLSATPRSTPPSATAAPYSATAPTNSTAQPFAQRSIMDLDLSELASRTHEGVTPAHAANFSNDSQSHLHGGHTQSSRVNLFDQQEAGPAELKYAVAANGASPVRDEVYERWRSSLLSGNTQPTSATTTPETNAYVNGSASYSAGRNDFYDVNLNAKSTPNYGYETLDTPRDGYSEESRSSANKLNSMKSPRIVSFLVEGKRMCTSIAGSVGIKRGRGDAGSDQKRKSPSYKSSPAGRPESDDDFNSRMQAAFQKLEKRQKGQNDMD